MAIACFRLVTFLPDPPLLRVPRFRSRITFSTFFWAVLPYRAMGEAPFVSGESSCLIADDGTRRTRTRR
jgi:hypothetical protein